MLGCEHVTTSLFDDCRFSRTCTTRGSPQAPRELRQAIEDCDCPQPLSIFNRGIAADYLARSNIVGNSTLCGGNYSITNRAVASDADLPGENHVVADLRGTGEAHLRTQQGSLTYFRTVSNLDEVVDLRPASNSRFADAGAIDTGVGLNFHIIFEHRGAGLNNLVPFALAVFRKTEAVSADDYSVLKNHVVSQNTVLTHYGMGMGEEVVPDSSSRVDHDMGEERAVVSDFSALLDDYVRSDASGFSDLGARVDHGSFVNARLALRHGIKELNGMSKGEIWILMSKQRALKGGEVIPHDDERRRSRSRCSCIFGIGYKRCMSGRSFFDAGYASDIEVCLSIFQSSAEPLRKLMKFHAGNSSRVEWRTLALR